MVKFNLYRELSLRLPSQVCPIVIGYHALKDANTLTRYIQSEQVLIVSNERLAPLYLAEVQKAFADRQCDVILLKDGEEFKNQQSLFAIYDKLIARQHHRDTTLVALGGGVVGDITGFAAATYQRGVSFVQIPTSLLAQIDAAIGGKTAINHAQAKNMIGCFYQPKAVIIDLATLETLPKREFRAGLAEMIKYALLAGPDMLQLLAKALTQNFAEHLPALVTRCCQIKLSYVEEDEQEKTGQRAVLNLGHTFAHALEACTHYQRWLHGEAVAIGLYCALLLSWQAGMLDKVYLDELDELLRRAGLPRRIPSDIDLDALRACMSADKKIKDKRLRFILMRVPGDCYMEDAIPEQLLRQVLSAAVEGE